MTRPRAYSDSTSPESPPSTSALPDSSTTSLTESSLAKLPSGPPMWPFGTSHSYDGHVTPSTTSVSDGEDAEGEDLSLSLTDEQIKDWVGKGKGKGRGDGDMIMDGSGLAGSLPPETLVQIFRLLPDTCDLQSVLLVSRTWCLCAFSLLWHKPNITKTHQLVSLKSILEAKETRLPYVTSIRRLNLTSNSIAGWLTDDLLEPFHRCSRVERLTLTGASRLSTQALKKVVGGMPALVAVDLSQVAAVEEQVMVQIARRCDRLQGMNLSGCKMVKLGGCHRLTDTSLVQLAESCPLLLEIDLAQVLKLTNATLHAIFLNACHLRELRLNGNINLSDDGIPNLPALLDFTEEEAKHAAAWYPPFAVMDDASGSPTLRRPVADTFEDLRLVDLTGCYSLGDVAIDNLVTNAPKLRNLTLAKCFGLTDAAVESIGRLGKHLHYLHLGHVSTITDAAVTKLARSCTGLRYIDLACSPLLTNLSVFELAANLPKLRRIGLVKVTNLTDEGIHALVERHSSLERIHLSYCEQVSVEAITFLLNRLLRLTHLSLTGVTAFKTAELQQFCRPAPAEFNAHQQASFCVYSGHGVAALRNYLNSQWSANQAGSDDASTRRGSSSSTSSITVPGGSPPRPTSRHFHSVQSSSSVHRCGSAPALRESSPNTGLGSAFASPTPNFLSPTMPGSYSPSRSNRGSRNSSTGSVPETYDRLRPAGPRFPQSAHSDTRASTGNIYARRPMSAMYERRSGSGSGSGTGGGSGIGGGGEARRVSEAASLSRLRSLAGMVGWGSGGGEGGADEKGPRGERR